ncbi:hypothetical protein OHJ28_04065 [Dickeya fangzhongdai]|nr:hypothetical protein [Dickeya fangzhongdai]
MNLHVKLTSQFPLSRQYWYSLSASMHLHENCYIKRAGVAGARLRAGSFSVYGCDWYHFYIQMNYR